MSRQVDHRPDLRLLGALGAVLFGLTGGLFWWAISVRDRLPDPIARHWGASGRADGYSSLTETLWLTVGITLVVAFPMAVVAVVSRHPALLRRSLAGGAAFMAVFTTVLVADSIRGQIDLSDASLAPLPGPGLLVGVLVGVLVGIGIAALVRTIPAQTRASGPPPPTASRLHLAPVDPSWQAAPSGLDTAVRVMAIVVGIGLGLLTVLMSWWLLPLTLLVVSLIAGAGRIGTRIDEDGLSARVVGLRVLHVPLTDVAEADVTEVDPFWDFGGWGLRVDVAGRVGLVTRKGPALRVRRGDDSEVIVTVDGAQHAAATLNTLAERHHQMKG